MDQAQTVWDHPACCAKPYMENGVVYANVRHCRDHPAVECPIHDCLQRQEAIISSFVNRINELQEADVHHASTSYNLRPRSRKNR